MSTAFAGGFGHPVLDSQRAFRVVMRAMANPGRIETLAPRLAAPAPLAAATAGILLTLCDFETRFWLSPALGSNPAVADYIRFHADARQTDRADEAQFAVVMADALDLTMFHQGVAAYPDRSTTVIVQCPALQGGPWRCIAGPGIAVTALFEVAGLPDDFDAQVAANRARFPLGADLILVCDDSLVALPRTTRIIGEAR